MTEELSHERKSASSISIQREIHICHLEPNESRNRLLIWNESERDSAIEIAEQPSRVEFPRKEFRGRLALEMRLDF